VCSSDLGERATRAYLVGGPPMLLMQKLAGGGRPGEGDSESSHWKLWGDTHAASGHAFMGAIPFLTAANMTDNPWAKGTLFVCSTLPGWSRINDDRHYVSQVWLGWWMAYLACSAVDGTTQLERHVTVTPIVSPEMTGVGVIYQR
jgi:hypothetical protein